MATARNSSKGWALGGVIFTVVYFIGDTLRGRLAPGALPRPGAATEEVVRYYSENVTASLVHNFALIIAGLALCAFAVAVANFVRGKAADGSVLPTVAATGGILAAGLLVVSASIGGVLTLAAPSLDLGLVETLRGANFFTGGAGHVTALGLFIGATTLVARRTKALPRWIVWWGFISATLAILSIFSLVFFPASLFILLGRMTALVWAFATGIALARGTRREAAAAGRTALAHS